MVYRFWLPYHYFRSGFSLIGHQTFQAPFMPLPVGWHNLNCIFSQIVHEATAPYGWRYLQCSNKGTLLFAVIVFLTYFNHIRHLIHMFFTLKSPIVHALQHICFEKLL